MAPPNLTVTIGPMVQNAVTYLRLAPSASGENPRFQLSFQAEFTNGGTTTLRVDTLRISFPAGSGVSSKDIAIKTLHPDWSVTNGLQLAAGATARPMDFKETDNIILTNTPPSSITFSAFVNGNADPATRTFSLAEHTAPVAGGTYRWMVQAMDLRRGEYWQGAAAVHCCGPQLYAHDFGLRYFDAKAGAWTEVLPGKDRTKNEYFRIWGKAVYAMADGVVEDFDDTIATNPVVGQVLGTTTPGNHFLIRHGDDLMDYCHFQKGSLNSALKRKGAVVRAGDFLGRVGNSGNSYAPHLHIHAVDTGRSMLRPIPWAQKMVAIEEGGRRARNWRSSKKEGLAAASTLIYPGDLPPADDQEWSDWEPLGGQLLYAPAVASWAPRRLDVFGIGTDTGLYHKWFDGSRWHDWQNLGGKLNAAPGAVSWGPNRIDVFGRGAIDNHLYHTWWDGSRWHAWEDLGGTLLSAPAVCSRRLNHLDVFVVATDKTLHHRLWNGSRWTPWESLGGELTSDLAAVSWSNDRIDVFGRATDRTLYQQWWNGSTWSGWYPRQRAMEYGPAVSSRRANHLDVFVVGTDGTLQHQIWNGSEWTRWESLGGKLTASPAAVSYNKDRIDIFTRGIDNQLYHTLWRPS